MKRFYTPATLLALAAWTVFIFSTAPSHAQVQCVPMSELRPDAVITPVMPDEDGDLWVSVRFRSTGRMLLGFLSHEKGGLCIVREGHTTPES
jgi:hypothetical protein